MTYANKEWFRITGLSALGDACDHWLDLVDDRDRAAVRADWEAALRSPWSSFSREFRFRRASATIVVWINGKSLAESEPAPSLADDVLGAPLAAAVRAIPSRAVIGAFTDVTHWREKEQQEIAALTEKVDTQKLRAEDAEAHRLEQERFVDVICHEIRNPLNGIVNNVDQLHEGRRALRELVVSLAEGPRLQALLKILNDEDAMLSAIDLCAYHQVCMERGRGTGGRIKSYQAKGAGPGKDATIEEDAFSPLDAQASSIIISSIQQLWRARQFFRC